jgi:hypothetical protein
MTAGQEYFDNEVDEAVRERVVLVTQAHDGSE